jgi:hypothetical protein
MGDHMQRMDLLLLNILQEVFPVFLDRSLSIAMETDSRLHQGTNVEVVTLHCRQLKYFAIGKVPRHT